MSLPAWQEVEHALAELAAPCSAAEAHGVLCGLLAMASEAPQRVWLERAIGAETLAPPFDRVFAATESQIDDAGFAIELLLPDDEEAALAARTEALAAWCGGFTTGVGLAGRREADLSAEGREFVGDVAHIAGAAVASEEDDEAAFAEVVEYLRMGVLLVRTESAGRGQ